MHISALYIYPIKSLGGISVPQVVVEREGFQHDRRFMLVTPEGDFITQRTHHQMALIDVAIVERSLHVWHRHRPDDVLTLPLEAGVSGKQTFVSIWDSVDVPALTVSTEADEWFSRVLGEPCRLVFMPRSTHRSVDEKYAIADDSVSFADGYPYLLIGQSSLDYLNQRMREPMSMLRFRPNVVVAGSVPNEEDAWAEFQLGSLDFYGVKPCARCVLTTIDPETAEQGREPLRTLTTYRRYNQKILFGQNVLPKGTGQQSLGKLQVGDSVTVLRREEPWLAIPEPTEQTQHLFEAG